jgi:hypothetical protein
MKSYFFSVHNDLHKMLKQTEDVWRENNLPNSRIEPVTSQEVVQRTLLHRTLSDSNLFDARPGKSGMAKAKSCYLTLPANFGRTKVINYAEFLFSYLITLKREMQTDLLNSVKLNKVRQRRDS